MPRIFSESRRRSAHIVLYRRGHSYTKLWILCQKSLKILKFCFSIDVDVIHHDCLPTSLTKAVYTSSTYALYVYLYQ
jgi:hypothetical protein